MLTRDIVEKQLAYTLDQIDIPNLGNKYSGKVRDCYTVGDKRILITSDRLSAFDKVLTTIPFKGQLLSQMAAYWFKETENLVPNHVISYPHPNVFITKEVEILPIEVIVRGYLTGSAWRDYTAGRSISGIKLPSGMSKSQRFDKPLITPSTKEAAGKHDLPISCEEIRRSGVVEGRIWDQVEESAIKLFEFGSKRAAERGLILVDTKYEFGLLKTSNGGKQLILADEIHTQDSSRYWVSSTYQSRFQSREDPEMLDKEFVRQWLIDQGFMGEGNIPNFSDSYRVDIALKYMDVYERITGLNFQSSIGSCKNDIIGALKII